jgi:hypothetical protein
MGDSAVAAEMSRRFHRRFMLATSAFRPEER